MDKLVYYSNLYDLYGELLTEKQKKYFEACYFLDLSFGEMSEKFKISRNALFKQINNACHKLEEYENSLHLLEKRSKLEEIVKKISDSEIREELNEIF